MEHHDPAYELSDTAIRPIVRPSHPPGEQARREAAWIAQLDELDRATLLEWDAPC